MPPYVRLHLLVGQLGGSFLGQLCHHLARLRDLSVGLREIGLLQKASAEPFSVLRVQGVIEQRHQLRDIAFRNGSHIMTFCRGMGGVSPGENRFVRASLQ